MISVILMYLLLNWLCHLIVASYIVNDYFAILVFITNPYLMFQHSIQSKNCFLTCYFANTESVFKQLQEPNWNSTKIPSQHTHMHNSNTPPKQYSLWFFWGWNPHFVLSNFIFILLLTRIIFPRVPPCPLNHSNLCLMFDYNSFYLPYRCFVSLLVPSLLSMCPK